MRMYLVGFMGAGKTTVGQALADELGYPFVDLDAAIERAAGMSVSRIFARHGEARFRAFERERLAATEVRERVVVATGGGTFCDPQNRARIRRLGTSVWLDPSFDVIASRLGDDAVDERPLFRSPAQAGALLDARRRDYRRADLHIEVGADDPADAVAGRIVDELRERRCAT